MRARLPIEGINELTNNCNDTVVEFVLFDSELNIECDGVDIDKMSNIFATQETVVWKK